MDDFGDFGGKSACDVECNTWSTGQSSFQECHVVKRDFGARICKDFYAPYAPYSTDESILQWLGVLGPWECRATCGSNVSTSLPPGRTDFAWIRNSVRTGRIR